MVMLFAAAFGEAIPTQSRAQDVREGDCGYDRWPVKIMRDVDTAKVDWTPILTTIGTLGNIPKPHIRYPRSRRIAPEELRVYRVRAIIYQITVEKDRDWHLVLHDPEAQELSMIAEIPDPACVDDPGLKAVLFEARRVLRTIPRHGIADIDGVGFFDVIHSQRGRTRNGFELHPVLRLRRAP